MRPRTEGVQGRRSRPLGQIIVIELVAYVWPPRPPADCFIL
jgi:hypothetical protein